MKSEDVDEMYKTLRYIDENKNPVAAGIEFYVLTRKGGRQHVV